MKPEDKLIKLGVTLPSIQKSVANYIPVKRSGQLIFTAGQLPMAGNKIIYKGKVGQEVTIEKAQEAARLCLVNALAVLKSEIGSLNKIKNVVRLNGYISSAPSFIDQAKVMNTVSDLIIEIFGEIGRHTRVSVGVAVLPLDSAVELDLIVGV